MHCCPRSCKTAAGPQTLGGDGFLPRRHQLALLQQRARLCQQNAGFGFGLAIHRRLDGLGFVERIGKPGAGRLLAFGDLGVGLLRSDLAFRLPNRLGGAVQAQFAFSLLDVGEDLLRAIAQVPDAVRPVELLRLPGLDLGFLIIVLDVEGARLGQEAGGFLAVAPATGLLDIDPEFFRRIFEQSPFGAGHPGRLGTHLVGILELVLLEQIASLPDQIAGLGPGLLILVGRGSNLGDGRLAHLGRGDGHADADSARLALLNLRQEAIGILLEPFQIGS